MNTLKTAAQQALEALEYYQHRRLEWDYSDEVAITALRAALAEPEGGGNLPPPLPGDFDHGIGADRFKVVRGAFWWHVLIGDSPAKRGKFHTQAGAEEMAALLLREFRNGAFVQHEAALAEPDEFIEDETIYCPTCGEEDGGTTCGMPDCGLRCGAEPVQEPVAWRYKYSDGFWRFSNGSRVNGCDPIESQALYTAPPQRKPLTEGKPWVCACGANLYIDENGAPRSKA